MEILLLTEGCPGLWWAGCRKSLLRNKHKVCGFYFFPLPFLCQFVGGISRNDGRFQWSANGNNGEFYMALPNPIHKMKECKGVCWKDKKGVRWQITLSTSVCRGLQLLQSTKARASTECCHFTQQQSQYPRQTGMGSKGRPSNGFPGILPCCGELLGAAWESVWVQSVWHLSGWQQQELSSGAALCREYTGSSSS